MCTGLMCDLYTALCAHHPGQTVSVGRAFLEQPQAHGLFPIYLNWFLPILPGWLHPQPIQFNGGCGKRPAAASPFRELKAPGGANPGATHPLMGQARSKMQLILSLASRTHGEQRELGGSGRGSQKDGWGPGGGLGGVLTVHSFTETTLCPIWLLFVGNCGGMGRGVIYLVICIHIKPQMAQPKGCRTALGKSGTISGPVFLVMRWNCDHLPWPTHSMQI